MTATDIIESGNNQPATSNAVKNELDTNYRKIISVSSSQNPDYITRYDISALLTNNCKLSIDIFTVIDNYKDVVGKVMITRYKHYNAYLYVVYNNDTNYPISLGNGILSVGNGSHSHYTYGGLAYVTQFN